VSAREADPFAVSPATERRVQAHLRQARGKSPRFLARRYRRSLRGYMSALETGGAESPRKTQEKQGEKFRYGT
jgi:hypothetical protein